MIASKPSEETRVSTTIMAITDLIRRNELGPGDKLPSELAVSKELNVSRTVVREAYRSLAAMRLISMSAGKRATVATLDHGAMSLMIEHGVLTEQISVQQIYDVRRTIEARTVTLAALRRSDEQAKTILSHAEQMAANLHDVETAMFHDLEFHLAIAKASKNPVFAMIVGAFQGVARDTWPIGWKARAAGDQREKMAQTHVKIAEAVVVGNPQLALEEMNAHFDDSVAVLLNAGIS